MIHYQKVFALILNLDQKMNENCFMYLFIY